MLMDSECAPLIPNLVRNHFSALAALNQLSKKRPALVDRVIMRLKSQGSREEGGEAEAGDVPYKVAPRREGRRGGRPPKGGRPAGARIWGGDGRAASRPPRAPQRGHPDPIRTARARAIRLPSSERSSSSFPNGARDAGTAPSLS